MLNPSKMFTAWVAKHPAVAKIVYADGLSSLLHALVVLIPSAALTFGLGAIGGFMVPAGAILGGLTALGFGVFYTKRELSDYKRFKADFKSGKLIKRKWDEKRKDTIRDFAFPMLAMFIGVGMAIDVLFGGGIL